jgi:hypothetical protein
MKHVEENDGYFAIVRLLTIVFDAGCSNSLLQIGRLEGIRQRHQIALSPGSFETTGRPFSCQAILLQIYLVDSLIAFLCPT